MNKWFKDSGFEKIYHIKNARFYSKKMLLMGNFETEFQHEFFPIKIKNRAGCPGYFWLMVAKYLNGGHIMYQVFFTDGQGREALSGALNEENLQKKLETLLKRLKVNEV